MLEKNKWLNFSGGGTFWVPVALKVANMLSHKKRLTKEDWLLKLDALSAEVLSFHKRTLPPSKLITMVCFGWRSLRRLPP